MVLMLSLYRLPKQKVSSPPRAVFFPLRKAFYGLALVLNSALLVSAAFVPGRLLPACLVAAACGLQNAMCTSHFGAIVRTTHAAWLLQMRGLCR